MKCLNEWPDKYDLLLIYFVHFVKLTYKTIYVYFLGASVCNIQAFQVLQSVFLKSNSASLCCIILDAISSVYHSDNANYFILAGQHTLSQFAEKIHLKPKEIQVWLYEVTHTIFQCELMANSGKNIFLTLLGLLYWDTEVFLRLDCFLKTG